MRINQSYLISGEPMGSLGDLRHICIGAQSRSAQTGSSAGQRMVGNEATATGFKIVDGVSVGFALRFVDALQQFGR